MAKMLIAKGVQHFATKLADHIILGGNGTCCGSKLLDNFLYQRTCEFVGITVSDCTPGIQSEFPYLFIFAFPFCTFIFNPLLLSQISLSLKIRSVELMVPNRFSSFSAITTTLVFRSTLLTEVVFPPSGGSLIDPFMDLYGSYLVRFDGYSLHVVRWKCEGLNFWCDGSFGRRSRVLYMAYEIYRKVRVSSLSHISSKLSSSGWTTCVRFGAGPIEVELFANSLPYLDLYRIESRLSGHLSASLSIFHVESA